MDYSKLTKQELLEIVQNATFENEEFKKLKENFLEIQKKEQVHLNGIRTKDEKIKELTKKLEEFEKQHLDVVKSIESQTKPVIANYQKQVEDIKEDYKVLKSTIGKLLDVNEVLSELKNMQDRSINKIIKTFNEALFEEGE